MEWIKYSKDSFPKKSGTYLCIVVAPELFGKYDVKIMSLYFSVLDWHWCCDNMIVAYWTEMPELPKEIVL